VSAGLKASGGRHETGRSLLRRAGVFKVKTMRARSELDYYCTVYRTVAGILLDPQAECQRLRRLNSRPSAFHPGVLTHASKFRKCDVCALTSPFHESRMRTALQALLRPPIGSRRQPRFIALVRR
jgi:hypothetical protein